jgi:hypothetical protein
VTGNRYGYGSANNSAATILRLPDGATVELADWIATSLMASFVVHTEDTAPKPTWRPFSVSTAQMMPGSVGSNYIVSRAECSTPRGGDNGLPRDWEALIYRWRVSTPIAPCDQLPEELRRFASTVQAVFVYNNKSVDRTTLLAMLETAPGWQVDPEPALPAEQQTFDSLRYFAHQLSDHEDTKRLPIHMRENLSYGVEFTACDAAELTRFKLWLLRDRDRLRAIADHVEQLQNGASCAEELRAIAGDSGWDAQKRYHALFTVHLEGLLKRPVL